MAQIAAVILAGGQGSRLGGIIKATLKVGGIRLIDRALAAVSPVCSPILISTGSIPLARFAGIAADGLIADLPDGPQGPMAGLAAAAKWLAASPPDHVLSLAVDTPFFPADFVIRANAESSAQVDAAMAAYAGHPYPTNTLWRWSVLSALADRKAGNHPRTDALRAIVPAERTRFIDYAEQTATNPFSNINTVQDLISCAADMAGRR